jgi:hypothetical protein
MQMSLLAVVVMVAAVLPAMVLSLGEPVDKPVS